MRVILYSSQISPRLNYIIDFFNTQISDKPVIITSDIDEFKKRDAVKINYSATAIHANELQIVPHTLLFEKTIKTQFIQSFQWNKLKAFFKTGGNIPFDIFAASFYLITRYEEYLPHDLDEYGRYAHKNSLAYKENFLHVPLMNLWIKEMQKSLQRKHHSSPAFNSRFSFIPTYDIDIAYQYLHHSFPRSMGSFYKDFFSGKLNQLLEHADVLMSRKNDPFDTYDWIDSLHAKYDLNPVFFFLLAEKRKGYDKNISPHYEGMQRLIKRYSAKHKIGIHPSWQSGDDKAILENEIKLLENISGKDIVASRQHYIRLRLPETYRLLIENGIKEDYSMGYGSINGFRASVSSPFYWYDLEKEEKTSLLIRPFCYMEANSFFEQHFSADEAAEELQQYHDIVKSLGGELITIFHNHFLAEQRAWIEWRKMYAGFLEKNFAN